MLDLVALEITDALVCTTTVYVVEHGTHGVREGRAERVNLSGGVLFIRWIRSTIWLTQCWSGEIATDGDNLVLTLTRVAPNPPADRFTDWAEDEATSYVVTFTPR